MLQPRSSSSILSFFLRFTTKYYTGYTNIYTAIDTAFFGALLLLRLLFYGALATQDRPQFPMHRQAA
ncbi:hypothetical protein Syun_011427 [Stephania yunnanensis]|uniref:Uncharacterized protein n=1 Tax=Stephania yunnanensis TaxID=152371 RepID=A0AAP0PFF5_9MAGN